MIDMHSHILPGIDDGAKNLEVSLQLIEKNLRDGVRTICLTPHFNFEKQTIEQFLEERQKSYELLKTAVEEKVAPEIVSIESPIFFPTTLLINDSPVI